MKTIVFISLLLVGCMPKYEPAPIQAKAVLYTYGTTAQGNDKIRMFEIEDWSFEGCNIIAETVDGQTIITNHYTLIQMDRKEQNNG